MNAKNRTTIIIKKTNGMARAAIFNMDSPVKPDTTNRFNPKGGVINPTPREVIIKIQNWISFIPMLSASGFKIGARITIFGVASITHPAITKITIINRINNVGSLVNEVTEATKP